MIINAFKQQMPALPNYKAVYRVIYFEPILLSGERLTIGVMVQHDTEHKVVQTINSQTLKCMYGDKFTQVRTLISLAINNAEAYLKQGKEIADWVPMMGGIHATEAKKTFSSNGMKGVLFQVINSFSSLYRGELVDDAMSEISGDDDVQIDIDSARLITAIRSQLPPIYQPRFHKTVDLLKGNAKITVDYLGINLNAAISNFNVKQGKTAFSLAKVKMFDLERLRDQREREKINNASFEVFLNFNKKHSLGHKDYINQLTEIGNSIEIEVSECGGPDQISELIVLKES